MDDGVRRGQLLTLADIVTEESIRGTLAGIMQCLHWLATREGRLVGANHRLGEGEEGRS